MLSKIPAKQFPTRRKMNLNLSKWRSPVNSVNLKA